MKPITFPGGGMLAGIATMLELLGFEATDQSIALGMEAPYLFVHTEEGYKTGASLNKPQWLNLYLHPRGYHLSCKTLEKKDVGTFLRTHFPALLRINIQPGVTHPAVFCGYENSRYNFINVKAISSTEPDTFSISAATLRRRLDDETTIYTLMPCAAENVDFLPLLRSSLDTLNIYLADVLSARQKEMSFSEFSELRAPLFRALMQDLHPMMLLIGDDLLAEALRKLNHHYRHVFTLNSSDAVALDERLPKKLIIQCVEWLKENIRDRIYELGEPEEDS